MTTLGGKEMNDTDRLNMLYDNAKCADANPVIFDATTYASGVLEALAYCRECPVTALCGETVLAPYQGERTFYSGVAGGRVWLRGLDRTNETKERAIIDWARVKRAVCGEDMTLLPVETKVACVAATAMGYTSREIGEILGLHHVVVKRYRTSSVIAEQDYNRATALGESLRDWREAA